MAECRLAATLLHIELVAVSELLGPQDCVKLWFPGGRKTTKTSLHLPRF